MNQVKDLKAQLDRLQVVDQDTLRRQRQLLRKLLKTGADIRGYNHMIRAHGSQLSSLVGSWARRRGRNFQVQVVNVIQQILMREPYSGVVHRCAIERYGSQPYDIGLYLRARRPVFLQCKAGGFQENSRSYVVCKNSRSMRNVTGKASSIEEFLAHTQAPYLFAYPHKDQVALVPARLVLQPRQRISIPKDKVYFLGPESTYDHLLWIYDSQV